MIDAILILVATTKPVLFQSHTFFNADKYGFRSPTVVLLHRAIVVGDPRPRMYLSSHFLTAVGSTKFAWCSF